MKTQEIETILLRYFNFRANLIVPNVSWGMHFKRYGTLHECDLLILRKSGLATEIEIKISLSDLKKDKEKMHDHNHMAISKLFFAVPEKLKEAAMEHKTEGAGLISIGYDGRVTIVEQPKARKDAIKWDIDQRLKLASLGSMRICGLKEKINKHILLTENDKKRN
jgi:hypothetical protein